MQSAHAGVFAPVGWVSPVVMIPINLRHYASTPRTRLIVELSAASFCKDRDALSAEQVQNINYWVVEGK
jgi:hypothetical protein